MRLLVAVIFVGWYALVPPADQLNAPLARWEHFRAFDTAKECEDMMLKYAKDVPAGQDAASQSWRIRAQRVRCVDSSDARLRP